MAWDAGFCNYRADARDAQSLEWNSSDYELLILLWQIFSPSTTGTDFDF
jgi:hypothetical protein